MATRNNSPFIIKVIFSGTAKAPDYLVETSTTAYTSDWRTASTPIYNSARSFDVDYDLGEVHFLAFIKNQGYATPTGGWGTSIYPAYLDRVKAQTSFTLGADVFSDTLANFHSTVLTQLTALEALATPVV